MSSNHTSAQLNCIHTEGGPRAATAATAAEDFCTCMERHILQNAINRIAEEEAKLNAVEQLADRLLREEGDAADLVRGKIERAAAVIRRARSAWREGRTTADLVPGAELRPTPAALVQRDDDRDDAHHDANNADAHKQRASLDVVDAEL